MRHCRSSILILVCILAVALPGCSGRKSVAVTPKAPAATEQTGSAVGLSEYIRMVLKISQENTRAAEEAVALLHERRPEVAALARLVAENARDLESRRSLAAAYMEEKLYPHAFQLYQEIQTLSPDDPVAALGLARIWNEWGDSALARQHAERAAKLDPDSAESLEFLGRILLRQNELDAAISAFLSAIDLEPDNPLLHANAGYAFFVRGDLEPARAHLQKAVDLDGSMIEAQNNLGIVLGHLGDYEGALKAFTSANGEAAALNNLGVVYLSQRQWRNARDAFRRALALDPNYQKARENLAVAASRLPPPSVIDLPSFGDEQGGPARAKETRLAKNGGSAERDGKELTFSDGIQIIAGSGRFGRKSEGPVNRGRDSRMTVAYRDALNRFNNRRYREAKEIFQWLLQQYPNDVLASNCEYWIGECYFGLGRYEKAKSAFQRVLAYGNSPKKRDAQMMMRRAALMSRKAEKTKKA